MIRPVPLVNCNAYFAYIISFSPSTNYVLYTLYIVVFLCAVYYICTVGIYNTYDMIIFQTCLICFFTYSFIVLCVVCILSVLGSLVSILLRHHHAIHAISFVHT